MIDCLWRAAFLSGADGHALEDPTSYNLHCPAAGQTKNSVCDVGDLESPRLHVSTCGKMVNLVNT